MIADAVLVSPNTAETNAVALRAAADVRRQGGVAVLDVGGNGARADLARTVRV